VARQPRIIPPGSIAHITNRGVAGDDIFLADGDRSLFLWLLEAQVVKRRWGCLAYCLMDNHYHLLLRTPHGDLSQGMQRVGSGYAHMFNKLHDRFGHVFQGRFKASLVEREAHALELGRYIALNPVRAGMVARPEDWPWSSYSSLHSSTWPYPGLRSEWLVEQFGGREGLQRFVVASLKPGSGTVTSSVTVPDPGLLEQG
jgi:REP element-mobilizing transposase RayT